MLRFCFSFLFLLVFAFSAAAQEIQLLDQYRRPIADSTQAAFYSKTIKDPSSQAAVVRTYSLNDVKVSEKQYSNFEKFIFGGINKSWHRNGQLESEIEYTNGLVQGNLKTYFENGQTRRQETYDQGKLVKSECFTKTGADTTYYPYQTKPHFPGGEQALTRYLQQKLYLASKGKIMKGLVIASFWVTPEGKIEDVKIVKSLAEHNDNAVIKMIRSMPDWKPGQQEGKNFPMLYALPLRF